MTNLLQTVQDIYKAMEQGNIAKIITVLNEGFTIRLAPLLGGEYRGREGILEVVSKMCGSGNALTKVTESFSITGSSIIVLGRISVFEQDVEVKVTSFADVWKTANGSIEAAELYYLDATAILGYLKTRDA
jgi:hypothetical protein